jgi:hypothetical protein
MSDKGDTGERGPQGRQGPTGAQGPSGLVAAERLEHRLTRLEVITGLLVLVNVPQVTSVAQTAWIYFSP